MTNKTWIHLAIPEHKKTRQKVTALTLYCNKEINTKNNRIVKFVASQSFPRKERLRVEINLQNLKINIYTYAYILITPATKNRSTKAI